MEERTDKKTYISQDPASPANYHVNMYCEWLDTWGKSQPLSIFEALQLLKETEG